MKIVVLGPQGSGKGTYASRLSPILQIPHISTGEIFRENIEKETPLGKEVKKFFGSGLLVPDNITMEIVKQRLKKPDCKNGFIFDGFPRTLRQAEELEKIAPSDIVLYIIAPEWILLERLGSRVICKKCSKIYNLKTLKPKKEGICDDCGGMLIKREDETPESIKVRLKEYEKETKPVIEYYEKKGILKKFLNDKLDLPINEGIRKILEILGVRK